MGDNDKERVEKNLQKTGFIKKGLGRRGRVELGICNLMAINQLLWMFLKILLESD